MKKVQSYRLEFWGYAEAPDHECLFSFKPNEKQLAQAIDDVVPGFIDDGNKVAKLLKQDGALVSIGGHRLKFEKNIESHLYIED